MTDTLKRFSAAMAKIAEAREEAEVARIEMQLECKHTNVSEVPYCPSDYFNATPPHRICADCGFAEWGWSCGYQILTAEPTRTKAQRIGPIWKNSVFVVSDPWKASGRKPRTKREAYQMAVRGTLPKEYLDDD